MRVKFGRNCFIFIKIVFFAHHWTTSVRPLGVIAIEYFIKSYKIEEEIGNQTGIARCYSNLGNVSENYL